MKPAIHNVAIHLAVVIGVATLIVLCIVYPFLPGGHDCLAVPLSTMVQVFGVVGLVLVPGGLVWLTMPRFGFALSLLSTAAGTGVALVLALFATLSVGNAFGVLTLAAWVCVLVQLIPGLQRLKRAERSGFHPSPMYLVCLPLVALAAQLALAVPMARASRDRAIANAGAFIGDIEQYHAKAWPVSGGAIYFSASADHIREKSGGERALELERNRGVRLLAPAAMIMAVVGGVQIYSLFHDHGQFLTPRPS